MNTKQEPVIQAENVIVRYYVPQENVRSIKEYLIQIIRRGRIHSDEFEALKGINLTVHKGEFFGIIGSNGAGKSTFLKLLARVMIPTEGRVWVKGQIAPLLAMGAGFHPDLTGRENIFLNGTLLGYKVSELKERFDRIVNFAGVREFIDSPIRTYSSGMSMRLAFAVATDRKPDILLVDEVMSVGDASFQDKSLERIHGYQDNGSTTVMVSHSMSTVRTNCDRVAWLDHGEIKFLGPAEEAVELYLENSKKKQTTN
jgi:ABC-type polysaccharide/polyol phosphate transport system ATPase subunit